MSSRVFVSSIMSGYVDCREAARRGIVAAGGIPVLVEDQPARPDSPRNACLDLVASSDLVICIIGPRGGYVAPSGKLVVEEEFEEAVRRGLPTLVFVHETARDPAAERLVERLSAFVGGRYRLTFRSPEELEKLVRESVEPLLRQKSQLDPKVVQAAVEVSGNRSDRDVSLRLALAPSESDEVVDPLDLDSQEFQNILMAAAHYCGFFSYDFAKTRSTKSDHLVLEQVDETGHFRGQARLKLASSGLLLLESTVTGSKNDRESWRTQFLSASFEILTDDLRQTASSMFALTDEILRKIDPHRRYESWLYNASLINIGMRRIVEQPAQASQASTGWGFEQRRLIVAYDRPRRITRPSLAHSDEEVRRTITLLRKRSEED